MIIDDISTPKKYDLEFPQKSVSTFPTVATYISDIDTSFATIPELKIFLRKVTFLFLLLRLLELFSLSA